MWSVHVCSFRELRVLRLRCQDFMLPRVALFPRPCYDGKYSDHIILQHLLVRHDANIGE